MKSLIFKDWGIRAMLAGKKRMTRRLMNPQPPRGAIYMGMEFMGKPKRFGALFHYDDRDTMYAKFIKCPFCVGDIFYAKETYCPVDDYEYGGTQWTDYRATPKFASSHPAGWENAPDDPDALKWKSPRFMPKKYARIFRKMINIKVERLQDISEEDALKEGVMTLYSDSTLPYFAFENEWRNINGNNSWDQNPVVWVYEYEETEG